MTIRNWCGALFVVIAILGEEFMDMPFMVFLITMSAGVWMLDKEKD